MRVEQSPRIKVQVQFPADPLATSQRPHMPALHEAGEWEMDATPRMPVPGAQIKYFLSL